MLRSTEAQVSPLSIDRWATFVEFCRGKISAAAPAAGAF
jgi:hypothetical protein